MQLSDLVDVSRRVGATRSRLQKRAALSGCLRQAAPAEVGLVVNYLTGRLPQGRIGLGPAILRRLAGGEAASTPTLSLIDVDAAFERITATLGKGSQSARREQLAGLFDRAAAAERDFLVRLILGELRQGALEGVLTDAIADAASLDAVEVRRAVMLAGDPAVVATAAMREGRAGLAHFRLTPLSPIQPMLAQPATDIHEAMDTLGEAALEYKLDGARVQIHKVQSEVRIFSRRLNDVTASLPEIVRAVQACPGQQVILDGEAIAMRADGRPHPFQITMSRFGRRDGIAASGRLPLHVFLFDCLHHDGDDLIDRPGVERFQRLAAAVTAELQVPRIVTADKRKAAEFLDTALAKGHEGVMAKSLLATYQAGNRGADWLKVKPTHTLDLAVLAVEWGSGRRRGWLSNLHLGARDPESGGFVMLGKTFKGLTDEMLAWQTQRLLELEIGREDSVVHVKPELVVEIAVNQIQTSPQYPAGMALRFARVKRYREDKPASEADTVQTVRDIFERQ
ncbi:MAG: ATP-dependent DNA ligase [Woeseia sp.]